MTTDEIWDEYRAKRECEICGKKLPQTMPYSTLRRDYEKTGHMPYILPQDVAAFCSKKHFDKYILKERTI